MSSTASDTAAAETSDFIVEHGVPPPSPPIAAAAALSASSPAVPHYGSVAVAVVQEGSAVSESVVSAASQPEPPQVQGEGVPGADASDSEDNGDAPEGFIPPEPGSGPGLSVASQANPHAASGGGLSRSQRRNAKRRAEKKSAREEEDERKRNAHALRSSVQLITPDDLPSRMDDLGIGLPEDYPSAAAASSSSAALQLPANLPPLYPSRPGWLADPVGFVKQHQMPISLAGIEMVVSTYIQQRLLDERFTRYQRFRNEPGRPSSCTVAQHLAILHEAGLDSMDILNQCAPSTVLRQDEFYKKALPTMQLRPPFTHSADTVRACQECDRPCRSECACGEPYCSRACQAKGWDMHKKNCSILMECHPLAMKLTKQYWESREERKEEAAAPSPAATSPAAASPSPSASSPLVDAADLPALYPGSPEWLFNPDLFLHQFGLDVMPPLRQLFTTFMIHREVSQRTRALVHLYRDAGLQVDLPLATHQVLYAQAGLAWHPLTPLPDSFPAKDALLASPPMQPVRPYELPGSLHLCAMCDRGNSSPECACGTRYCGERCRESDWSKHRAECERIHREFEDVLVWSSLYWESDPNALHDVRSYVKKGKDRKDRRKKR